MQPCSKKWLCHFFDSLTAPSGTAGGRCIYVSLIRGSTAVIRVPTSTRETTSNQPPCFSTIHLAMDRPRPVPPVFRSRERSAR